MRKKDFLIFYNFCFFYRYFGFVKKEKADGLGLILDKKSNDFINIGNFKEGILNGLGREFKDSIINDGIFKNGELQNSGIYNKIKQNLISYKRNHLRFPKWELSLQ